MRAQSDRKLTVLLTSRNPVPEWLATAIQSAQPADRVLVHIDAGSAEALRHCEPGLKTEYLTHEQPMKAATAINWLAKQTETEWICWFCDDDEFIQPAFEKLLEDLHAGAYDDVDVVCCPCLVNGKAPWGADGDVELEKLREHNLIAASSLVRRTAFQCVGGLDDIPLCDWGLWLKLKARGAVFGGFSEPTYIFRHGHDRSAAKREVNEVGGFAEAHQKVLSLVK